MKSWHAPAVGRIEHIPPHEAQNSRHTVARPCKETGRRKECVFFLRLNTNIYRAAWKSGEVIEDPEKVYSRIREKHLVFAESKEEKEVRVDNEHVLLSKRKRT